jgi:hypothetical protein
MSDGLPDVGAFGALYMEFMRAMRDAAKDGESPLLARIGEHLGQDPTQLASTGADFAITDHPNLQLALDSTLPDAELLGFSSPASGYMAIGFNTLVSGNPMVGSIEPGPVQYTDAEVGDGRIVRCASAMREHNVYRGRVISLHGGEEQAHSAVPRASRH